MENFTNLTPLNYNLCGRTLQHYTNFRGLRGILESNCFHATHFSSEKINDKDEIITAKKILIEKIASKIILVNDNGNRATQKERHAFAEDYVEKFYSSLLDNNHGAFIAAFCMSSEEGVDEDGKLSFWDRYGAYALVFDYSDLMKMVEFERNKYLYQMFLFREVLYNRKQSEFKKIDQIMNIILKYLKFFGNSFNEYGKNMPVPPFNHFQHSFNAFSHAILRFKNKGFFEEEEVRMVFVPREHESIMDFTDISPDQNQFLLEYQTKQQNLQTKKINHAEKKSYIEVFDWLNETNQRLPVKSILIGPGEDKQVRANKVQALLKELGLNIPIRISETSLAKVLEPA